MNRSSAAVRRQLAPGESLVWEGQPSVLRKTLNGLWGTLFGLFFGVFGLFFAGEINQFTRRFTQDDFFSDFALPLDAVHWFGYFFALVGLSLIFTPVWNAIRARRTFYAVTDRRAIMIEGGVFGGMRIRSFTPSLVGQFDKFERLDGSGSLMFSSELYQTTENIHTSNSYDYSNVHDRSTISVPVTRIRRIGFSDVPNVTAAEQALRRIAPFS